MPIAVTGSRKRSLVLINFARFAERIVTAIVSTPTLILERYFGLVTDGEECSECTVYKDGRAARLEVHGQAFCHQCARDHVSGERCNRQVARFCIECNRWRILTVALKCRIDSDHELESRVPRRVPRLRVA